MPAQLGGDLSRRIDPPSRHTEVGRLADALDTMLGRIEAAYRTRAEGEAHAQESEDRMRQFIADASHELRTPLTSVGGLAEFGLQQGASASPDEADSARLRQVIDNLIGNAIQHTTPGSPVTVSVPSTTGIGEIIVADNGQGMTAEQAARVFERFYRTDDARTRARGGTGLGLPIAASLAAAHSGDITVVTQPGHGASFHVRLPLAAAVATGI